MLKLFSAVIAIRDLIKYLYQVVGLARDLAEQSKVKKLDKAVDEIKKGSDPEIKKDALRDIVDNAF